MSAAPSAVHSLWTLADSSSTIGSIKPPTIEYAQLSPMLVLFAAAALGILVEAFVPRRARYWTQVGLALAGLTGAFVAIVVLAADGYAGSKAHLAAMGAVAVDGPALFLQGTIVLISVVAVLGFAERRLESPGPPDAGCSAVGPARRSTPSPRRPPPSPAATRRSPPSAPASPPPRSSRSPCSPWSGCCSSRPPGTC